MSKKNVELKTFNDDILIPETSGFDSLTGQNGFSMQKFAELIVSNVMENVLSIIPLKYYTYLPHHVTTRNNQIKTNNTYQNYNFGTSAPSLNQNNSIYTNPNWLEFVKTDDTLGYYDAIKIHVENDSFLNVRSIMYVTDTNGASSDRAFSRITVKDSNGDNVGEVTVAQTVDVNGRETLTVEFAHKISDGAVITLPIYGLTSYTFSRLFLSIEVQELLKGNAMIR